MVLYEMQCCKWKKHTLVEVKAEDGVDAAPRPSATTSVSAPSTAPPSGTPALDATSWALPRAWSMTRSPAASAGSLCSSSCEATTRKGTPSDASSPRRWGEREARMISR